jgi:hypothetical protein
VIVIPSRESGIQLVEVGEERLQTSGRSIFGATRADRQSATAHASFVELGNRRAFQPTWLAMARRDQELQPLKNSLLPAATIQFCILQGAPIEPKEARRLCLRQPGPLSGGPNLPPERVGSEDGVVA